MRARLRRVGGGLVWYLREVSGESAYERYLAHRQEHHPGEPTMSRRDFERWRQDRREGQTQARCC